MQITNTTTRDLGLGLGGDHIVPAGGSLEVPNDALTAYKASPVVKGWFIEGALVETGGVSLADIAVMTKHNVCSRLSERKVEFDRSSKVADLRELLASDMFGGA